MALDVAVWMLTHSSVPQSAASAGRPAACRSEVQQRTAQGWRVQDRSRSQGSQSSCLYRLMKESMKWKEKIAENQSEPPPETLFSQWAVQRELNWKSQQHVSHLPLCPSPPSPIAEIKTNVVSNVAMYRQMKGSQACCTCMQMDKIEAGSSYLPFLPVIYQ